MTSNTHNKRQAFLLGLSTKARTSVPKTSHISTHTTAAHRRAFGDDDEDDDDDAIEMLVGFEDNKAKELTPKTENKPLAIAPLSNIDWRAKKKQLYVPAQAQAQAQAHAQAQEEEGPRLDVLDQSSASFGLQIMSRTTTEMEQSGHLQVQVEETSLEIVGDGLPAPPPQGEKEEEQSLEAQALQDILKSAQMNGEEEKQVSTLVIPFNETEAFREDIKTRPDEATMDDYENVPVEEFGAALLRGLGWSEGEGIGRNRKTAAPPTILAIKQRDSLLGLGAKPEKGEKEKKKASERRSGYEYKESSLFKKIARKKYDDEEKKDRDISSRSRDRPRSRDDRSSRDSSSRDDRSSRNSPSSYSRSSSTSSSSSKRRTHSSRDRSRSPRSSSRSSRHEESRDRYKY
ncbi:DExH-box splicing factor binding site-domain-containing protein [Spinellus fusiger]|nr:DExH-box splicing factor binding site-domain-containing protein [Spinellus fusiger]